MSIIADRGLVVWLLVQSGKFASADAEAFADAMDAAPREPATKTDLIEVRDELKAGIAVSRTELKGDIAALRQDFALLDQRLTAMADRIMVRVGGPGLALAGLLFAALRLVP